MTATITADQFASLPNGIRLHYASAGQRGKPLLLFVHGFPECWFAWENQLQHFGDNYFAVAPDLRGFNLSDMPQDREAYKARHIVEDLRLLIAELGYQQCVLVAHDWGGAIAWNFAIALPRLLQQLIIINAPHPYLFMQALAHDPVQQAASAYMNWLRAEGTEGALAKDDFKLMDGFFTGLGISAKTWFTPQVRERYHACWRRGLHGGLNYYRGSPLYPPMPDDPGARRLVDSMQPADFIVTVPTRVIWGMADTALPPALLDGLERFVADLTIERIADCSHWVVHEKPQHLNQLIRTFVSQQGAVCGD